MFIAASSALVVTSALGVLAGSLLSAYINQRFLSYLAGVGFMMIGAFILASA